MDTGTVVKSVVGLVARVTGGFIPLAHLNVILGQLGSDANALVAQSRAAVELRVASAEKVIGEGASQIQTNTEALDAAIGAAHAHFDPLIKQGEIKRHAGEQALEEANADKAVINLYVS